MTQTMTPHSSTLCIKSIKPQKLEPNITPTENFNFGEGLESVYPLLDLVFQYLPFNDLKTCVKVCKTWRDKAEGILSKRTAPSWFSCYRGCHKARKENNATILTHSDNLHYNNGALGIIFYDSNRLKMNKYICLHSNIVNLSRKSVPEYLEEELVPKCVDYCLLSVHRVVSFFNTGRTTKDVQYHASIFDGVFIPKIPSIRTVMFHCNPSKKKDIEDTVSHYIKPNEEAKCLLLFCKTQLNDSLYNLLEYLVPKKQPNLVALGGCVIKGTKTFQQISHEKKIFTVKDTICILFLKDENKDVDNFNAYSCVIKERDLTKEEFNSKLKDFKENITLKTHSLGFRLCCSAKYQETELQSFEEVLPEVPLIGLEAYGEIGWNCYPNASYEGPNVGKKMKRTRDFPVAESCFSTIFVLLTWD